MGTLFKEDTQMTNNYMERCPTALFIRKMANQNHNDMPPHTHQDGYNHKIKRNHKNRKTES